MKTQRENEREDAGNVCEPTEITRKGRRRKLDGQRIDRQGLETQEITVDKG